MTKEQKDLILEIATELGIYDLSDEEIVIILNGCSGLHRKCIAEKIKEIRKPKIEMHDFSNQDKTNVTIDDVLAEVKALKQTTGYRKP